MLNFKTLKLPKQTHGEVSYNLNAQKNEYLKKSIVANNLNTTSAGQKAKELDKADGVEDGKISASVLNKYVKEHNGKTVKEEISVIDAMNSITTYDVIEAQNKAKTQKTTLENKTEDNIKQPPEMGL